ncbi:hypothetical protein MHYP_G00099590 [Metynnis hypsauchen]
MAMILQPMPEPAVVTAEPPYVMVADPKPPMKAVDPSPPMIVANPKPPMRAVDPSPPMIVANPNPPMMAVDPSPPIMVANPNPPMMVVQASPTVIHPVTVVQHSPGPVVVQPRLKVKSGRMTCQFCRQDITTVTKPISGALTWTIFATLLLLGIWPFCLIPFCVKCCKDIQHTCPYCHNVVYIHKRM